jgi:hypothetical protein
MFCLLGSDTEQHFDVAAQLIDAVCGDLCSARCLGEDEGALDDGLCVQEVWLVMPTAAERRKGRAARRFRLEPGCLYRN